MTESEFKIEKLSGPKNWPKFEREMRSKYVLDDVDQIVLGIEQRPTAPPRPTEQAEVRNVSNNQLVTQAAKTLTKKEKDDFEKELAEWQKSAKAWDRKNARAVAKMVFHIEAGPQAHIEGLNLIADQWATFVRLYKQSDLVTRDKAMFAIARADSAKYATIDAYATAIKAANQTLLRMGLALPEWQLNTFFRLGLEESLAPLLFRMIRSVRGSQKEPSIDDMSAVLRYYKDSRGAMGL